MNFDKIMEILKLENYSQLQDEEKIADIKNFEEITQLENCTFLDKKSKVPQIFFASLMRSGNTLLRRIFEDTTGIITGSNLSNLISASFSLTAQGFKGEYSFD
jgi:hypothetical protein